jgi:hypothetical protein
MVIFNSYVKLPEGNFVQDFCSKFGASRKRIGMPSQFQLIQTSATAPWMPLRALERLLLPH